MHDLPCLDKRVIYVDQFGFSNFYNYETSRKLPEGHEAFIADCYQRLKRLVMLHQIILPHSDIHRDETIVWHGHSQALRQSYESIGGDIAMIPTGEIELNQILDAADAFISGHPLQLDFSVDEALAEPRNVWLSKLHISVQSDFNVFADEIRRCRDDTYQEFMELSGRWGREKKPFSEFLTIERDLIPVAKIQHLSANNSDLRHSDPLKLVNAFHHPVQHEARQIQNIFAQGGVARDRLGSLLLEFWSSDLYKDLPHNRISSHLFAAIARRVSKGEKLIDTGLMNDVRLICCYAPYVDALFLDNKAACLLREEPLARDLHYKARIFSLATKDEFINYLNDLEAATPPRIRDYAQWRYGPF